jgi:Holliday junction resolvase RusA-like endonuclease
VVSAGGRQFVQNYVSKRDPVNVFKASVQDAAARAHRGAPLLGPLAIQIVAVFPRPKSKIWAKRPMPREAKVSKPDVDNILKAIADALTGILWIDDCQLVDVTMRKLIASGDEQAHCEVEVGDIMTRSVSLEEALRIVELRRQKVLANPSDPSWTEHFAELQNELRDASIEWAESKHEQAKD